MKQLITDGLPHYRWACSAFLQHLSPCHTTWAPPISLCITPCICRPKYVFALIDWVIFLHLAANLWSRSPPTGQIFCENCNLSTGRSHMKVSPPLSGPAFATLLTGCFREWAGAFLPCLVSLFLPHLQLRVVFLTAFYPLSDRQHFFWSSFICFYSAHSLQSWIYRGTRFCGNHMLSWWRGLFSCFRDVLLQCEYFTKTENRKLDSFQLG